MARKKQIRPTRFEAYVKRVEIEALLRDPLTCSQSFKSIARFTGAHSATVRRVYWKLVTDGVIPEQNVISRKTYKNVRIKLPSQRYKW